MWIREIKSWPYSIVSVKRRSLLVYSIYWRWGPSMPSAACGDGWPRWRKENESQDIGRKRGTKYRALEHTTPLKVGAGSCFGSESIRIIEQVRQPLYTRNPAIYNDAWFDAYQPNKTFYISANFRSQLQRIGEACQT